MEDKKYWLGLKILCEYDNRLLSNMLEYFKTPEQTWEAHSRDLKKVKGITMSQVARIQSRRGAIDIDAEVDKLKQLGIGIITLDDHYYPELLRQIFDPPPVIFYKGELIKVLSHAITIAIVGARQATTYGRMIAEELASGLSQYGVTVVSGVARGIDSAAHRGALRGQGSTVGVLGCGLDVVYPPENQSLYEEIALKGSLITEYPPGTYPAAQNFPARNRIISGLCEGVVVVEASEKSGALITADFALEQGREVFAVPGSIRSNLSKGCHKLLRAGACLVESVEDILHELGLMVKPLEIDTGATDLSEQEKLLLRHLGWESRHIDEVTRDSQLDVSQVSSLLMVLELKGFLRQDSGNRYLRVR